MVFLKTMPWVSGKYFFRPLISSSGSLAAAGGRADVDVGREPRTRRAGAQTPRTSSL